MREINKRKVYPIRDLIAAYIFLVIFCIPAYEAFWGKSWGIEEDGLAKFISLFLVIFPAIACFIKTKAFFSKNSKEGQSRVSGCGFMNMDNTGGIKNTLSHSQYGREQGHPAREMKEVATTFPEKFSPAINPASGAPMNGSFDIHGNSYGAGMSCGHAGHTSVSGNTFGMESHINPTNGAPMNGGVDVYGNPYGTDTQTHHTEIHQTSAFNDWDRH